MITLYHAPKSRSSRIVWLLEELGEPYEKSLVSIKRADGSGGPDASYRAIHPHGKVPAIVHDGHTVFETAAICLYLADAFPAAKLGPAVGHPDRASFLTWLFYTVVDVESASAGKAMNWANLTAAVADPDEVFARVSTHFETHEYALGYFSAVDIVLATDLQWAVHMFKSMPSTPGVEAYIARCHARPAYVRALAND